MLLVTIVTDLSLAALKYGWVVVRCCVAVVLSPPDQQPLSLCDFGAGRGGSIPPFCKERAPKVFAATVPTRCRSTTAANIPQPRVHQGVFGADRIDVFAAVGLRRREFGRHRGDRLCRRGSGHRRGLVVAGQPRGAIRDQFAFTGLGDGGLGQRANRSDDGNEFHMNTFLARMPAMKCCGSAANGDYSVRSESFRYASAN